MTQVFYSSTLDALAEDKAIKLVTAYKNVDDWVEVSEDDANCFYFGTTMPEGKQRKGGTLELEDIEEIALTDEEMQELRALAYADSATGSDRLFVEYQALLAQDLTDEAEEAKTAWLTRRAEIKEQYPLSSGEEDE